ncbi:MAG: aspartate kinase [Candidatus Methylarchaceae archaeon HK02M2]|nr:aspartate kinase [Candidatus Methylarchaceae archaeon HK02M2]
MKKPIIVVKFGGSVLMNEKSVKKAADMIKSEVEKGSRIVVIVSALKGQTDELLNLVKKIAPNLSASDLDEILAMGEKTSARIMSAALTSRGLDSCVIDTESPNWPIITDDKYGNADPSFDETKKAVDKNLLSLIESGKIPVICGFIGKNRANKVTTMGRGGSDTTAVLLGSCLNAKEVVLVKDVGNILTADPSKVNGSVPIDVLDPEEAYILAAGGAKILQNKALRYKNDDLIVRILSLNNKSLTLGGTVIGKGSLGYEFECYDRPITMVTIVGKEASDSRSLILIMDEVQRSGGDIISITSDEKSSIVYISNGRKILNILHELLVEKKIGKAVSSFENLSLISIRGRELETNPGIIQRFITPLADQGINIYGLVTISSSLKLFISNNETEKALTLLRRTLKGE